MDPDTERMRARILADSEIAREVSVELRRVARDLRAFCEAQRTLTPRERQRAIQERRLRLYEPSA